MNSASSSLRFSSLVTEFILPVQLQAFNGELEQRLQEYAVRTQVLLSFFLLLPSHVAFCFFTCTLEGGGEFCFPLPDVKPVFLSWSFFHSFPSSLTLCSLPPWVLCLFPSSHFFFYCVPVILAVHRGGKPSEGATTDRPFSGSGS